MFIPECKCSIMAKLILNSPNSWKRNYSHCTNPKYKPFEASMIKKILPKIIKRFMKSSSVWLSRTKFNSDSSPKVSAKCTKWLTFCWQKTIFSGIIFFYTTKSSPLNFSKRKSIPYLTNISLPTNKAKLFKKTPQNK